MKMTASIEMIIKIMSSTLMAVRLLMTVSFVFRVRFMVF